MRQSGSTMGLEALTEMALRQLDTSHYSHPVWKAGPFPQHERFNGQNRFSILSFLMQCYCHHLDAFHSLSLSSLCKATARISGTGFATGFNSNDSLSKQPRMAVHPSLLVEMCMAAFFAMFYGSQTEAVKAIEATHQRANYELYSDVLLVTNGLLNSLKRGHLQVKEETGPSAAKVKVTSRSTITNASFKTTKLPDDIEIQEEEVGRGLGTVEEESDPPANMAKNLKAKLLNIGGKLAGDKGKGSGSPGRRDSDTSSIKSSGQIDMIDSVGVAVKGGGASPRGGPSSTVMVDMLELRPLGSGSVQAETEEVEEKEKVRQSSGLVFSKKSGFLKTSSTLSPSHESSRRQSNSQVSSPASATPLSTNGFSSNISNNSSSNSSVVDTNSSKKLPLAHRASSEGRSLETSFSPGQTAAIYSSITSSSSTPGKMQSSHSESNIQPSASSSSSSSTSSQRPASTVGTPQSLQSMSGRGGSRQDKSRSGSGSQVNSSSFSTDL